MTIEESKLVYGTIGKIENETRETEMYRLIPCKERLPKEEDDYLCQSEYGSFSVCGFTKDAYKKDNIDFYHYKGKRKALFYEYDSDYGYYEINVIAWMPLPKPYKEVEE